ncbi:membrane protein [Ureibacillus manganicus DSM 26584]|uniref:Membrane protein n=1 Tax=Ureibacillus manganicus DSM 26584 TaxID=1384049 RepID=A0A0A3I836_9BACL|nr:membrane protein [Ureibacillus manganicus DSM 26584]
MFGIEIQTVYLTTLIVAGCITVLYILFSDALDGVVDGILFFNPSVILAFITITSASGYLLEQFSPMSSLLVLIISSTLSAILSSLLYFFILVPLKSAEVSLAYTEQSLEGQIGKVIVPIPKDGFGEVVIETAAGIISKRATGFDNEAIDYNDEILIIEVKDGTLHVKKYQSPFK